MAAGTLTSIAILPANNIVNTRTTYDIIFKTATTGTIKTIDMTFPPGFEVSAATSLIERIGIGSGSLSAPSSTTLIYTVSSPVSVPAGTTIRLEIGRIVNSNTAGSFQVSLATKNTTPVIIDVATSPSFPIKSITEKDVSPSLMKKITLLDDATGNSHGWNPNGVTTFIQLHGFSDVPNSATIIPVTPFNFCRVSGFINGGFFLDCDSPPSDGTSMAFTVINAPVTPP
jgi:hypothetical protein